MNTQQHTDNRVQLWLAPVAATYDDSVLAAYEALLDVEERVRWRRFQYPIHRQRFLVGRAFMRTVLADCLERSDPATLQFTHMPYGKPELAGLDAGKLHFNLSHTDDMLVLAVSRKHAVGVDVEALTRKVELMALAQRYFATHEYEAMLDMDAVGQRERFFTLWTLKEAWLKARGLGLQIPLDDFSFSFAGKHPTIQFGPQLADQPENWQFRLLAQDQFRIALAVNGSDQPVQVHVRGWGNVKA
jgi:4'-phosphopantetheinyl transferase